MKAGGDQFYLSRAEVIQAADWKDNKLNFTTPAPTASDVYVTIYHLLIPQTSIIKRFNLQSYLVESREHYDYLKIYLSIQEEIHDRITVYSNMIHIVGTCS